MIVKEDKIIVLFGHRSKVSQLPMSMWSILSADLLRRLKIELKNLQLI